MQSLRELLEQVPRIALGLGLAFLVTALVALPAGRRGGRFRGLPGWVGFWLIMTGMLLALSHLPRQISLAALAVLMFSTLRGYFFVVPVRPRDRYAILASYFAIPLALYPAYIGSNEVFLATVPIALFLGVPIFLAAGRAPRGQDRQEGMLDALGRTLLGVVYFVFCLAHLGLLPGAEPEALPGRSAENIPQLFGILVLAAELPRRMTGDFKPGAPWWPPLTGALISLPLVVGLGMWLGPECGLEGEDAARVGALMLVSVTIGAAVSRSLAGDLDLKTSALVGRGAMMLAHTFPVVYAAPVCFHYLNHFAA